MKHLNIFPFLLILSFSLANFLPVKATSSLYVSDPQSWSVSGQGSIDEAVLTIEPKGVYMEYSLYLSFSAAGHGFTVEDTLEVDYNFTLPEGSIIHDSWLWFDGEILKADIMDRSSAYAIYESIVSRRRDPSVLYKNGNNNYHMQVFPLAGHEQRKVKISFLVPVNWQDNRATAPIPTSLLTSSYNKLPKLKVITYENEQWTDPKLTASDTSDFQAGSDKQFGDHLFQNIYSSYYSEDISISFSSPMEDGLFIGTYTAGEDNYYQMAVSPKDIFDVELAHRYLFLLDFEKNNTSNMTGNEVYSQLKSILKNNLGSNDTFNIFISGTSIQKASSDWLNSNHESIDNAFENLGEKPVKDYSNLQLLLEEALEFTSGKTSSTSIILLSNSDNQATNDAANTLYNYLNDAYDLPQIQVVDFYNINEELNYFGGKYFYGNEYFFNLLARNTGGNFMKYVYGNQTSIGHISKSIELSGPVITAFDLSTTLPDGFTFAKYTGGIDGSSTSLKNSIWQIGKYYGDLPITCQIAGLFNGQLLMESNTSDDHVYLSDTLVEEMWTGNYINSLEGYGQPDNQVIDAIVEASINERVLSRYTAFLAIEPSMREEAEDNLENQEFPMDETGEEFVLDVNNFRQDSLAIEAYPNPFTHYINITAEVPEDLHWKDLNIQVYNNLGQLVKTFDLHELEFNNKLNIRWDGKDSRGYPLSPGIYYLTVTGENVSHALKLIKSQ